MLQCAKLTELPLKKIIPFRLNYGQKKGFKKMKISLVRQKRGRHARREWKAED